MQDSINQGGVPAPLRAARVRSHAARRAPLTLVDADTGLPVDADTADAAALNPGMYPWVIEGSAS